VLAQLNPGCTLKKQILKLTMQRTDRKKADNRDRKIHESEHRNKNSKVKTSREEKILKQQKNLNS